MHLKRYPFPDPAEPSTPWGTRLVCVMDGDLIRLESLSDEDALRVPALLDRIAELGYSARAAQVSADDWRTMYEAGQILVHDLSKEVAQCNGELYKMQAEVKRVTNLHNHDVKQLTAVREQLEAAKAELEAAKAAIAAQTPNLN